MTLCTLCIYPDTRPDAHFVDGVCSGCRAYAERAKVNWALRRAELLQILADAKAKHAPYDCVVPVSGGKDSTYQVLTLLEMGAKVLAVNAGTDMPSAIGRRNLDNLKRFCDVIEWTPNVEVRKKLIRIGLRQVGDLSYPEHLAIWAIPTRVACMMRIPLVVWGEQPQREYQSPPGATIPTRLDGKWVAEFGGLLGLRVGDLVGQEGLTDADLEAFRFPDAERLGGAGVQGIWLGEFLDWDGWKNAFIAQQFGFEFSPKPVETSLACYENLDNHITVLRDYLRFLKYGYTRATDIACNHIRRGRISRDEALTLEAGSRIEPKTSLGMPIEQVLDYIGISMTEWKAECAKWTTSDC
jgi:N-acetyl sugar amidotransferase